MDPPADEAGSPVSDRNPGFTDEDAADLDVFVGTCHLCDDQASRVVAVDARFQHKQTAYCVQCLRTLIRRIDAWKEKRP